MTRDLDPPASMTITKTTTHFELTDLPSVCAPTILQLVQLGDGWKQVM